MNFKNFYKPNKEFKEKTKLLFLSAAQGKFGIAKSGPSPAFKYFIRGVSAGVAVMILLTSAATYADETNVGPNNIFYSLKRAQEAVKTAFTKNEEKPTRHLELAERRLEEIKSIQEGNPESPKISDLSEDFEQEIENSLGAFEKVETESKIKKESESQLKIQKDAANKKSEDKKEKKKNKKDDSPPSLQSFGASSAIENKEKSDGEEEDNRKENKEEVSGSNFIESKNYPLESKTSFCNSWLEILKKGEKTVNRITENDSELINRFNEKCRTSELSIPTSTDTSHNEFEKGD